MSFFHGNYFAWCSLLLQMSFSSQLQLTFDISNRQYLELINEIFGPVVTPYAYKLKIIRYLEFRYISRISRYLERFLRSIGIKSLVISNFLFKVQNIFAFVTWVLYSHQKIPHEQIYLIGPFYANPYWRYFEIFYGYFFIRWLQTPALIQSGGNNAIKARRKNGQQP